ncbi:MAG: macro domain-containing protein [Fimbriimonas sp.]
MNITVVEGDLLDQTADAIVNPWNRNTIPWWLLLPQGVSGAIKRHGGTEPFRELARHGRMALGDAIATGPGRLPYRAIVHVAGIDDFWRASEASIRRSVRNAMKLVSQRGYCTIAFPIIGAGSGGFDAQRAEQIMLEELAAFVCELDVILVRFQRG